MEMLESTLAPSVKADRFSSFGFHFPALALLGLRKLA